MFSERWSFQDAKIRFGAIVAAARRGWPQIVTRRGVPAAVILAIDRYETVHYPIALPDPVDAILFRMDQQGLTPRDLVPYMGSERNVSAVLASQRQLSLSMIRKLHRGLGIPAEVLIQETRVFESATA